MSPKWLRSGAIAFSRRDSASHAMRSMRTMFVQHAMPSASLRSLPLHAPKSAPMRTAGGLSFQRTPAMTSSVSFTPAVS